MDQHCCGGAAMRLYRIFMILAALSIVSVQYAAAGQYGESLSRLYQRLNDLEQKYSIMQELAGLDDNALEPFFLTAIDDLVYGKLSHHRTSNTNTYDSWLSLSLLTVKELGEFKAQGVSGTVWDLARTAKSSLLKAECLISLGKMNAVEYTSDIAMLLHELNLNQRPDRENAEIEAYGAAMALRRLRNEKGFESLFYASIGWYKDRVTNLADEFTMNSYDTPVVYLSNIIKNADDYQVKRHALDAVIRVNADAEEKVEALAAALQIGLRLNISSVELNRQLAQLRLDVIRGYADLKTLHPEMPDLLRTSINRGDKDEKLLAIHVLGIDGSDAAVTHLAEIVLEYAGRQDSGVSLSNDEISLLRQCIFAIGDSGSEVGLEALQSIQFSDFTPMVKQLAVEAVKKIQNK